MMGVSARGPPAPSSPAQPRERRSRPLTALPSDDRPRWRHVAGALARGHQDLAEHTAHGSRVAHEQRCLRAFGSDVGARFAGRTTGAAAERALERHGGLLSDGWVGERLLAITANGCVANPRPVRVCFGDGQKTAATFTSRTVGWLSRLMRPSAGPSPARCASWAAARASSSCQRLSDSARPVSGSSRW